MPFTLVNDHRRPGSLVTFLWFVVVAFGGLQLAEPCVAFAQPKADARTHTPKSDALKPKQATLPKRIHVPRKAVVDSPQSKAPTVEHQKTKVRRRDRRRVRTRRDFRRLRGNVKAINIDPPIIMRDLQRLMPELNLTPGCTSFMR